jgi:hypothetical protein
MNVIIAAARLLSCTQPMRRRRPTSLSRPCPPCTFIAIHSVKDIDVIATEQPSCLSPSTFKVCSRRPAQRPPRSTTSSRPSPPSRRRLHPPAPANPSSSRLTSSPSTIETWMPVRAQLSPTSRNTTRPSSFASAAASRAAACAPPAALPSLCFRLTPDFFA